MDDSLGQPLDSKPPAADAKDRPVRLKLCRVAQQLNSFELTYIDPGSYDQRYWR